MDRPSLAPFPSDRFAFGTHLQATSDSSHHSALSQEEEEEEEVQALDVAVTEIDGVVRPVSESNLGQAAPRRRASLSPRHSLAGLPAGAPKGVLAAGRATPACTSCGAVPASTSASALGMHPDIAVGPPLRPDVPVPEFHLDGSEVMWLAAVFGTHAAGPNRDVVRVSEGSHHAYH